MSNKSLVAISLLLLITVTTALAQKGASETYLPVVANALLPATTATVSATATAIVVVTPTVTPSLTVTPQPGECSPGRPILDPLGDVSLAHVDVTILESTLTEDHLSAVLTLQDLPASLTFNRVGVPANALEYAWSIFIDVDNNPNTGYPYSDRRGTEYQLAAMHFVYPDDVGSSEILSIPDGVQVNTWEYTGSSWRYLESASLQVNAASETLSLTGRIPGIAPYSRLVFETYDYNPGDSVVRDTSTCALSQVTELIEAYHSIDQVTNRRVITYVSR